jgi:hypothetical protein
VFQRYAQEYLQVAALAKQEKLEGWQWRASGKCYVRRKQIKEYNSEI